MTLCEFIRVHFDDLVDRYYWKGLESLDAFPEWAFELYLRNVQRREASEDVQGARQACTFSSNKVSH